MGDLPSDAQRKLLVSADANGRVPFSAPKHVLRACKRRGWVESRQDNGAHLWLGDFVTDAGREALAESSHG